MNFVHSYVSKDNEVRFRVKLDSRWRNGTDACVESLSKSEAIYQASKNY